VCEGVCICAIVRGGCEGVCMCGGVMPFANLYAVETLKKILRDPQIYERHLLKRFTLSYRVAKTHRIP